MSGFKSVTPVDSKAFNDAIYESCDVLDNFLVKIQGLRNTLNDSDHLEVTTLYLQHLQSQLDKSVNDIASKFNMPANIIKEKIINFLKVYANQGDLVSQSLLNSWGNLSKPFDDLLNKAKDAVTYLGASPQEFTPALNAMAKGFQKIDPLTGKLTEQFKKAHDALKEWANITFDKLSNRIQKLRKAVEGGFINSSALENEFRNALPQIKLQVISELEPIKNQFASQYDYQSIVASKLVAKVQDLFGEVGTKLLRNLYDGMKGIDIGQSILHDVQRESSGSMGYININGIQQSLSNAADTFNRTLNNTGDSMISFINSIRTPADIFGNRLAGAADEALSRNSGNVTSPFDYSVQFSNVIQHLHSLQSAASDNTNAVRPVVDAVRNLDDSLASILNLHQSNSNSLAEVINAVQALHSAVSDLTSGNTFNIEVQQNGFNIHNQSEADSLARSTVNAIRTGLGNGGL